MKNNAEAELEVGLISYEHGVGEGRRRRRDSLRRQRRPTYRSSLGKLLSSPCGMRLTKAEMVAITEKRLLDIAYLPRRKCRNLLMPDVTRVTAISCGH